MIDRMRPPEASIISGLTSTRLHTLAASWVLPVSRPAIRDGCVAIEGSRIAWVGERSDPHAPGGPLVELGDGVLLPGLVNAHCHLELSHLASRLDVSRGFVGWVESLVAARLDSPAQDVRAATAAAVDALVATGTAAVGDVSNALAHVDLLGRPELTSVVFHELIGWDPAHADAILASAEARLGALAPAPGVEVRLAAHAPHSVSPALLRALVARGGPAAIHLAESPAESRFLRDGDGEWAAFLAGRGLGHVAFAPAGVGPIRYADMLGVLHDRLLAAHCAQAEAQDCGLLARRGVSVAVCPRSNRNLGLGLPPVPELLARGVRLCLGTDSLASVDSLDLAQDMAALRRAFPGLGADRIVHMATAGGAAALGLSGLGRLERGCSAALAFAPAPGRPIEDPAEFLVSGGARPRRVA
jgi:cytosine/adenosine deaminase-related metal-dependent hydrolase